MIKCHLIEQRGKGMRGREEGERRGERVSEREKERERITVTV